MKLISFKERVLRSICVVLMLVTCLSFVGCNNTITTKVEDLEWKATAEIHEWKTCYESGWEVPEGAVVYKEQEEIRSYKIVGYETKYKTEKYQELVGYYRPTWRPRYETRTRTVSYQVSIEEPIYATKYYYTIEKWVYLKSVHLASGHDKDYTYSDYVCGSNERVANVEYKYLVKLECDESYVSYIVDKDTWEGLEIGQEITGGKDEYGRIKVDWETN